MEGLLLPGSILHLFCTFTKPEPKHKFFVVGCLEPRPLLLYINSTVRRFVDQRPDLRRCHVIIDANNHSCLSYDSYVDCTKACAEFGMDHIRETLARDPRSLKGFTSDSVRAEIVAAVKFSPTLSRREKEWILDDLR